MTESLFFDSDCICSFLWVKTENLLVKLYPGRIVIPMPVYDELSNPVITHLKNRVDKLIDSGHARIETIFVDTEIYDLYYRLISSQYPGQKIIGKGEASSIALAKSNNGIIASNNLKDISLYVQKYNLKHVTTGDILIESLYKGYINEEQGNILWASMIAKRRKIGANSFSEYLQIKRNEITEY